MLNDTERNAIYRFAGADMSAYREAIDVYRRALRRGFAGSGDPYLRFMSEVDNVAPDLLLRARYRRQVLELKGRQPVREKAR